MKATEINRRQWLTAAGAAGFVAAAGLPGEAQAQAARKAGLQLYTVRASMAEDVEATLQAVAGIGYQEVEFAGYFDHSPAQIRALLDRYGLVSPSAHASGGDLRSNMQGIVDAAAEVGHDYVTIAWMPPEMRRNADDWYRWVEDANRLGELCRDAGMRAAYHNHDFEFQPVEGVVPFELLLAETDPTLVDFELDFYWVKKGGQDILDTIETTGSRTTMAHIKDMDSEGNIAPVGAGTIDFAAILADPRAASIRHPFVEHDHPKDPFRSIAYGHYSLTKALG